jgi:hypothetical protein
VAPGGNDPPIETARVPAVSPRPESQNRLSLNEPSQSSVPAQSTNEGSDDAGNGSTGDAEDSSTGDTTVLGDTPPARFEPALSRRIPWPPPRRRDPIDPPGRQMGGTLSHRAGALADQDELTVMRRLHSRDPQSVQLAREELTRRGFDDRHLRMAEDLTSPDPQVRLRFAQALPRIRDVDIRPWLKTLAEDEDPNVRLAAVAIIATSGLPESLTWLRQLDLRETDPRVRDQLQKGLEPP